MALYSCGDRSNTNLANRWVWPAEGLCWDCQECLENSHEGTWSLVVGILRNNPGGSRASPHLSGAVASSQPLLLNPQKLTALPPGCWQWPPEGGLHSPWEEDALPLPGAPLVCNTVSLRGPLWWNTTGLSNQKFSLTILEPENLRLRCWQVLVFTEASVLGSWVSLLLCLHMTFSLLSQKGTWLMFPYVSKFSLSSGHQSQWTRAQSNGLILILLPLQRLVSKYGHIRVLWVRASLKNFKGTQFSLLYSLKGELHRGLPAAPGLESDQVRWELSVEESFSEKVPALLGHSLTLWHLMLLIKYRTLETSSHLMVLWSVAPWMASQALWHVCEAGSEREEDSVWARLRAVWFPGLSDAREGPCH